MTTYKEFQKATPVYLIIIPVQISLIILYLMPFAPSSSLAPLILINVMFAVIYLLFYGMKTTVDHDYIRIRYGIGLIQKKIRLTEIEEVCIVSNPWYYGWGVRFIPEGMLYNIRGFSSVELVLYNSPRRIRIGTANPESLKSEIQSSAKSVDA